MKDKIKMIRAEDAIRRILDIISPLPLERVGILTALGRVLGEDIAAGRDIPPGLAIGLRLASPTNSAFITHHTQPNHGATP